MRTRKKDGRGSTNIRLILIALVTLPLFILISSFALTLFSNPQGLVGAFSLLSLVLAALTTGIFAGRLDGGAGGLTAPIIPTLLLLLLPLVISGTGSIPRALMNGGIYIAVFLFSRLIFRQRRGMRRHRR